MMSHTSTKQTNSATWLLIFLIILISGPEFATDMYVPSLPAIAHDLHILKSSAALTITAYLLGMALFQFIYGGFSDRHGRRKTIIMSTLIYIAGNLMALFSPNFTMLMIARAIQGAGAGGGLAMTLAIARDTYQGPKLAKLFGILFAFYFTMFGCAPIIGGYLQHYLNWRYTFVVLTIYFLIQLAWVIFLFKETYTVQDKMESGFLKKTISNYWQLMKSKVFMGNMLACSFIYSGLFAYAAISPFLFQKEMHLSAVEYGWLGLFIAAGLVFGNIAGAKLVDKMGLNKPNYVGAFCLVLGSSLMLLLGLLHFYNPWVVMVPFVFYILGIGITAVTCPANALTPFGHIAGSAGALWGALQFVILFLLSFLYAHLNAKTQISFAITLMLISVSVTLLLIFLMPRKETNVS